MGGLRARRVPAVQGPLHHAYTQECLFSLCLFGLTCLDIKVVPCALNTLGPSVRLRLHIKLDELQLARFALLPCASEFLLRQMSAPALNSNSSLQGIEPAPIQPNE